MSCPCRLTNRPQPCNQMTTQIGQASVRQHDLTHHISCSQSTWIASSVPTCGVANTAFKLAIDVQAKAVYSQGGRISLSAMRSTKPVPAMKMPYTALRLSNMLTPPSPRMQRTINHAVQKHSTLARNVIQRVLPNGGGGHRALLRLELLLELGKLFQRDLLLLVQNLVDTLHLLDLCTSSAITTLLRSSQEKRT